MPPPKDLRVWLVRRADWPRNEWHAMISPLPPAWASEAYEQKHPCTDQCRVTSWLPMELAPRDGTPILALCHHGSDPGTLDPDGKKMTLYAAHTEGMSHVVDGPHVVVWGGGWDDRSYEEPNAGWLPDWWFLNGSDFEVTANPVGWLPIPKGERL